MKRFVKALASCLYKAWLRSRMNGCARELQAIAAQREYDLQTEQVLQRELSEMRSKLQSL